MRVTVWKNEKESNERLVTRFNKKVQSSRKLLRVRAGRYNKKPLTRRLERVSAIIRERYRSQKEKSKFY